MKVSVHMTPEQLEEWESTMLPDRDIDCAELARKIVTSENMPRRITAMITVEYDTAEFLQEILESRIDCQTRVMGGDWKYSYDPLYVNREDLRAALIDSARWELRNESLDPDMILWSESDAVDPDEDNSGVFRKIGELL